MKHPRQIAHTNKKYIAGHLELEEGRRIGIVNGCGFLLGVIKIFWIRVTQPYEYSKSRIIHKSNFVHTLLPRFSIWESLLHLSHLAWRDTHTFVITVDTPGSFREFEWTGSSSQFPPPGLSCSVQLQQSFVSTLYERLSHGSVTPSAPKPSSAQTLNI